VAAKIEHVVVLMLENRSFDHLFGLFPGADGIVGTGAANLLHPSLPESATNPRFPAEKGAPFAIDKGQGPSHSLNGTNVQLFNDKAGAGQSVAPSNSGFVANYADTLRHDRVGAPTPDELAVPMRCFTPDDFPALNALAREFVLCDRWFAEVPGPTMPNRLYAHAATSAGYAHNDWQHLFDFRTIYENLNDAGKSWAVYFSDDVELAKFSRINHLRDSFRIFEDRFSADAKGGKLPSYTFIIPRFASAKASGAAANSMHAPDDPRPGDALVADVYEALRASEEAWGKTLLIVTFDEHGGFFDHVAPPSAPNPDDLSSPAPGDPASFAPVFGFDRLGLRVPTILVSPWLPKGKIDSTPYQHTSILATAKAIFGLPSFLTRRDASARSFEGLLGEAPRADTPQTLPRIAGEEAAPAASTSPDHPSNQPPDELIESLVAGWDAILKATPGVNGGFEVYLPPEPKPATHGEAQVFLKKSVLQYLQYRAREVAEEAAAKEAAAKEAAAREAAAAKEAAAKAAAKREAAEQEAARQEAARQEAARQEAARQEAANREAAARAAASPEAAAQFAAAPPSPGPGTPAPGQATLTITVPLQITVRIGAPEVITVDTQRR
jgi:phospholipase C